MTIKKRDPKSYFCPLVIPRHAHGANLCITVFYSSLRSFWFATWLCTKWILDPSGHTPWPCHWGLHWNSECVPPVLIHMGYYLWQFQSSSSRSLRGVLLFDLKWLPDMPPGHFFFFFFFFFAPLCSTLHYLRFDMQHDYVCTKWILDPLGPPPPGPCPKGLYQNSEYVPPVLIHRAITKESFEILA